MASSSSSGSDRDDAFDEDMEALRRACMLAGADPTDVGGAESESNSDTDPGSSASDDLGLLRRLQQRFTSPFTTVGSLPFVTPLTSLPPPESDDDCDFETLRAIQRRFTQYESDSLRKKTEKILEESELFVSSDMCGPKTPNRSSELRKEHGYSQIESQFLEHEGCNSNVRDLMSSKFPKSAQNFVDALKKNRSCQKFIRRKLIEIEAKIEKNKELKERIKCLMDFQVACKRKVGNILCQKKDPRVMLISVKPTSEKCSKTTLKKVRALCLGPDENAHVSKYRMVLKRFPVSLSKQPWSKIEKENLAKGIKQQYQEMLILNSMNIEGDAEGTTDQSLMSAITFSDFEFTPEKIRYFIPMVNWNRLASMYVMGRSGAECEARWLNCEDPMINHNPWTVMEDKKLLFIVQERGIYNWIDISIALGTQRTPFQCLVRYQRSLNPHILNKDWTEEEDAKLRAALENYGDSNWQIVASCLEGRTGTQCSNRWKNTLNPARKKVGRWSVDEDKRLKIAVMLFGAKHWSKIARFAPGRTQVQCRERWLNCLDPALNLKPWTAEEDAKLLDAIAMHGNCWSKIAACIPPRTDNQCRRRWKILCPGEVILLQAAAQIKKTALISNFVDRESERPAIGPHDFTPLIHSTVVEKIDDRKVRKKKIRDNQPKKSRAKPRRVLEENSKEDHVTDLVPTDLALLASIESNSMECPGISKSRNKRTSGNRPKKSRVKSRRSVKENSTEDFIINTYSDVAPTNMSLVTFNTQAAEDSSKIRAMYGTDGDGNDDGDHDDSSLLATFYKKAKRQRKCVVTEENTKAAEDSPKIRATYGGDDAVADADDSSLLARFCKKTNRKWKRRMTEENTLAAEDSAEIRAIYGGDDGGNDDDEIDDSSLLATFYNKAIRQRRFIITEENTKAPEDSSKMRAIHGGGSDDDDDSSVLASFYKKAKRKRKCIVSEENTKASEVSSKIRAIYSGGGGDDDDSSLLAKVYKKGKRKRKCGVTEESTQASEDSLKMNSTNEV